MIPPPLTPDASVLDWLLDSDPSIRWQVMRDLTGASAHEVAAERAMDFDSLITLHE